MKKISKKIIFIFLFICLLNVNNVFAKDKEQQNQSNYTKTYTYINPLYKDVITEKDLVKKEPFNDSRKPIVTYATEQVPTSIAEVAEKLKDNLKKRNDTIIVSIKVPSDKDFQLLIREIVNEAMKHTGDSTEGDYLQWQYGGWNCSASYFEQDCFITYTLTYTFTYYTTIEQETELTNELKNVYASLNLKGSDYEKITTIYNYIINNVKYDYDNLDDYTNRLKFTAYAALINKKAVCQGYALLLYRMALDNGIDARLIAGYGNGGAHAWNIIKIGKYYYNADSTWDAAYTKYENLPYYLKSNNSFTSHIRNEEYNTDDFNKLYPMSTNDYDIYQENERLILNQEKNIFLCSP